MKPRFIYGKKMEKLKKVLEEHLNSINDNSSEIQALFDYVQQVEVKIDKLNQRLEKMQLCEDKNDKFDITPLNQIEKTVFLILYTEEAPLSYHEISEKSGITISLVPECISSLVQKSIPLERSYLGSQLFFQLNRNFKEMQAKENLVNLSLQSFIEQ